MKIINLVIFFLISFSTFGFDQLSEKESLRSEITKRIENVIKTFDPQGRVDVSLSISKTNKNIKAKNPFLLSFEKSNQTGDFSIKKVSAVIFSQYEKIDIPSDIQLRIGSALSEYSKNNDIVFTKLLAPSSSKGFGTRLVQTEPSQLIMVFLLGFACFFAVYAFYGFNKSSGNNLVPIVQEGIAQIANSLEALKPSPREKVETTPFNIEVNAGNESFLIDVSLESIEETLMDCYWCEEDSYAAYLWDRLDVLRKGQLIKKNKRIADYASHVQTIEPNNKKFISDSYYLSPLPLESIDNESLSRLVEQYHSVFHLLPKVRVENLELSALKKKELFIKKFSEEDTNFELQNINWEEFKTTINRNFERLHVFEFKDFQEEEDFFKENSHDVTLINAFPSLAWLTLLRDEDISEILSSFTAKQLAIAWHAPENTLNKLESFIAAEKLGLLKTYKESLQSGRNNSVFMQIMNQVSGKLQNRLSLTA